MYWKNNVGFLLSDGTKNAAAYGLAVDGTDIYVSGYENNGNKKIAKYWKNGIAVNLTDGQNNAVASGIAINGSDVCCEL